MLPSRHPLQSNSAFAHQLNLLLTIAGVSLCSGGAILAAIGDISRFSCKQKLAGYFGLTPKVKQSGEKCRMGQISKQGNSYARFMAIEAAEHFRDVPLYNRLYGRIKKKKKHNVAKVAIARKLIEVVWVVLTKNEEFIYARPRLTDDKRARARAVSETKSKFEIGQKAD